MQVIRLSPHRDVRTLPNCKHTILKAGLGANTTITECSKHYSYNFHTYFRLIWIQAPNPDYVHSIF